MIRDALVWLKTSLGVGPGETAVSWSDRLEGSLNFWSLLEGTHLLALMLFFGTIAVVDLRMIGLLFGGVRFSRFSDRVLPLTIAGFGIVTVTGVALFFAKPLEYYHNAFFRLKMVLLLLALANLIVFHLRVQRTMAQWDANLRPPRPVRLAGATSLVLWVLVIACGRYIPANWYACGRPNPEFMNAVQECAASEAGAALRPASPLAVGVDGR